MTPPTLNITEETYVIDSSDSLSISCRYSALTQGGLGLGPSYLAGQEDYRRQNQWWQRAQKAAPQPQGREASRLRELPGGFSVGSWRHRPCPAL